MSVTAPVGLFAHAPQSARLYYRPLEAHDRELLAAVLSHPAYGGCFPLGRCYTDAEVDRCLSARTTHWRRFGFGHYVLVDRDGRAVGYCGFQRAPGLGTIEIAYGIIPSATGRGYAGEAVAACISFAFSRLGVRRIVATVVDGNIASRRVLERSEMKPIRRRGWSSGIVSYEARTPYRPPGRAIRRVSGIVTGIYRSGRRAARLAMAYRSV